MTRRTFPSAPRQLPTRPHSARAAEPSARTAHLFPPPPRGATNLARFIARSGGRGARRLLVQSGIVGCKPLAQDAHEPERRFRPLAQDRFERRLMDLEDADVEIHKPAFEAILRERPETALGLMRVLCERLAPYDPALN